MKYLVMLSLLLVSCATPARRELRDGPMVQPAPTFVTPGYTPAGAGLPEYMPAAEAPTAERSPHRRVLPETPASRRGPGIWAGDEPVEDLTPPRILGVPLLTPDDPKVRAMARRCEQQMDYALVREAHDHEARNLELTVRACLAAKLYQHCAAGYIDEYNERRATDTFMDKVEEARRKAMKAKADEMVARRCPEEPPHLPPRPGTIYGDVAGTWTKIMRGQPDYGD